MNNTTISSALAKMLESSKQEEERRNIEVRRLREMVKRKSFLSNPRRLARIYKQLGEAESWYTSAVSFGKDCEAKIQGVVNAKP